MSTTFTWDDAAVPVALAVRGEVDLLCCEEVSGVLAARSGRPPCAVDLDASAVTFLDPAGLSVLLVLAARLRADGHSVCLQRPSAPVLRLLALTGAVDLLTVDGSPGADGGGPAPELLALRRSHLFCSVEDLVRDGTSWEDASAGSATSQRPDGGEPRLAGRSETGDRLH